MQDQVYKRLKERIDQIAAVDAHSHISPSSPSASHLGDVLFYHYITTELISAGMPPSIKGEFSRDTGSK